MTKANGTVCYSHYDIAPISLNCFDCAGGIVESTLTTIKKKTFEDAGGCHDDPCRERDGDG